MGTLAGGSRPSPALAETNGVPLSSHLAPELSAHLLAATPAAHWLEYHDWLRPILQEPIAVWDGRAMPSAVPGAGLSWDEEAIRRFLFSWPMWGVRQRVTEQFLAACNNGDLNAPMAVLAPGVALYADSGGRVRAPRRPIEGADKVARFFLAIWPISYSDWIGVAEEPDLEVRLARVNDGPGLVVTADGKPIGALVLEIADGVIQTIDLMANPDKLAGLRG